MDEDGDEDEDEGEMRGRMLRGCEAWKPKEERATSSKWCQKSVDQLTSPPIAYVIAWAAPPTTTCRQLVTRPISEKEGFNRLR